MVKVTKIAAWKIGNKFFEEATEAEAEARRIIVEELLAEQNPERKFDQWFENPADIAEWISRHWAVIEARLKAAMAGS